MKTLIDVHAHLAAFPDGTNGCFMSKAFQSGIQAKFVRWKLGLTGSTPAELNASYTTRLLKNLRESLYVEKAVLLALDGVYDASGRLDENRTHMLIANDCVRDLARAHPDALLYGASINPQRRDALDELNRVIADGARLIKVLPPTQVFDPLEPRYRAFYRTLADRGIPLLCHIGYEFSVSAGKQEFGFPERLTLALDEGVSVIGAHGSSSAVFVQGRFYRAFVELMTRYPNFCVDLSATTLPNRASIVPRLRSHPEFFDRYLFGTDYPLSAYATPFLGRLPVRTQIALWRTKNIFDKQALVLRAMGLSLDSSRARALLHLNKGETP